ncbi:hypothetical protein JGU71_14225 [Antrihabitans sp. YC3-6]|uniref:Uncharacterized protein n=1 Tax=Antrihabitans stalagmiti TaxID=2799499 RepID=A0A934NRK8_9NOCA|nr:hypothetical protein [Antrihabitans stalagmiti]MBJ8340047.1 hypothetical protein [Antrihabitans stalagmiti]
MAEKKNMRTNLATLQERLERTVFGEALISAMVVTAILVAVVWSMPESTIRRAVLPPLAPIAIGVGLDQNWRVFAPDPPRRLDTIEVHVFMPDGSDRVWTLPHGDPIIGQYSWYRWQKLKENLLTNLQVTDQAVQLLNPELWTNFVHWVAKEMAGSEQPARAQVLLQMEALIPPGSTAPPQIAQRIVYDEFFEVKP